MTHLDIIIERLEFVKGNIIANETALALQQLKEALDLLQVENGKYWSRVGENIFKTGNIDFSINDDLSITQKTCNDQS